MNRKTAVFFGVCLVLLFIAMGCHSGSGSSSSDEGTTSNVDTGTDTTGEDTGTSTVDSGSDTEEDDGTTGQEDEESNDSGAEASGTTFIALSGGAVAITGTGATADGPEVTISEAGTYSISGTLSDGQILVDAGDDATVTLILNGVDITCGTSSPIHVAQAELVEIVLPAGTENTLTDTADYVFEASDDDEPDAALFSRADLVFSGTGSLEVNALYNDGIKSKDGLTIKNGVIAVSSVDDGIVGKDYLIVSGGSVTVDAEGDGMKSTNDEDTDRGYISITDGLILIESGRDAVQAETDITVAGGELALSSGGGSSVGISDDESAKGLKAGGQIILNSGILLIDSADDAVHAAGSIVIADGVIAISSGDDGIHSDTSIEINGSDIIIDKSYEGVESAAITINGGTLHVVASDDGINVAGGNDGSAIIDRPGRNTFTPSGNYFLTITGGYCFVEADGDGIDVNGSVTQSGGIVLVNGPTANDNGALDYDGTYLISGGFVLAAGSRGMAQAPSASSSQPSILASFSSTFSAGQLIHMETAQGVELFTFAPTKPFQSVVFSSPDLTSGSTVKLYYGGSSSGTQVDGLYQDGSYSPGTLYSEFTVSQGVTTLR